MCVELLLSSLPTLLHCSNSAQKLTHKEEKVFIFLIPLPLFPSPPKFYHRTRLCIHAPCPDKHLSIHWKAHAVHVCDVGDESLLLC